jgi:hypothetical protein
MNYTKQQSELMFDLANKTLQQTLKGVDRESIPYIQTFSGKKFRHMWPLSEDVDLNDIARGLSLLCRFGGQIRTFYSIAQHAVLVSQYCDPNDALEGLHHDDSEGLGCVDIPRPLKRAPGMEVYRMYERLTMKAIEKKFNLRPEPESVKLADSRMLVTEARDLFQQKCEWSDDFGQPFKEKIIPWAPEEARERYLDRHFELTKGRK